MQKFSVILSTLALVSLSACAADEKCEPLANHIVEIVAATQPDATAEAKELAKKDTLAACAKDVPEPAVYDCAMAAKTVEELNACDEKATKKE